MRSKTTRLGRNDKELLEKMLQIAHYEHRNDSYFTFHAIIVVFFLLRSGIVGIDNLFWEASKVPTKCTVKFSIVFIAFALTF